MTDSTHTTSTRLLLPALLVALAAAPGLSAQGETAFVRGKGKLDLSFQATRDTYDHFWVGKKRMSLPEVGEVERFGYSLYAAYGATDDLDLILSGAYIDAESDGTAGFPDESDFQDLLLAAKWRVLSHMVGGTELTLALLPGVKVPLTNYENNAVTAIGDGQTDLRARLVGQVRFPNGMYAALETGYDLRNGAPHNEVPVHLTLGATFWDKVTVSPFLSHVESLGGTDIGDPGGFNGNEEDYTRTGVSVYWRLRDRIGLTGGWRTTLDGRNTGDVDGFSVGMVLNL